VTGAAAKARTAAPDAVLSPVLAFGHLCVDGVCAATLFHTVAPLVGSDRLWIYVTVYNMLAFAFQGLIGVGCDSLLRRFSKPKLAGCTMLLFPLALLPLPALALSALLGVLNSFYHVFGGVHAIGRAGGKLAPLGVFVAPGALGLCLGTLFSWQIPFAALLALLGAFTLFVSRAAELPEEIAPPSHSAAGVRRELLIPLLILFSVTCRGVASGIADYPWKTGIAVTILFAAVVVFGKAGGGLLHDLTGPRFIVLLSAAAAVLLSFFPDSALLTLAGQFLINCTMPLTLFLLIRCWPDMPGLAFGSAAGALYVGVLLGSAGSHLTGAARTVLIPALLTANAAALFAAARSDIQEKQGGFAAGKGIP